MPNPSRYYVYILRCVDGTFYTGVATDLARRVHEHNTSSKGAKYTMGRRPVTLAYSEECASRSEAQKREHALKSLTRSAKQELISSSS